jgi:hypothetical protein
MKILYFFLYLWVIFALLDPDPATQINADPDRQPWNKSTNPLLQGQPTVSQTNCQKGPVLANDYRISVR